MVDSRGKLFNRSSRRIRGMASNPLCIQGPPFGFDIMYLALADRNMQVRFGLKVVGES